MRLIDADLLEPDADYDDGEYWAVSMVQIHNAPIIEPKKGRWIEGRRMKFDGTFYWYRECNQCGYERNDDDTEKDSNFCPNCGADMREGEADGRIR